jgi:hypothetical protein
MDYLKVCDTYTKKIVFVFNEDNLDDLKKYFCYLLHLCIEHKIRLYYLTGNPLDKYVNEKFHIGAVKHEIHLFSIHHLSSMLDGVMYVVNPILMHHIDIPEFTIPLDEIFYFTDV